MWWILWWPEVFERQPPNWGWAGYKFAFYKFTIELNYSRDQNKYSDYDSDDKYSVYVSDGPGRSTQQRLTACTDNSTTNSRRMRCKNKSVKRCMRRNNGWRWWPRMRNTRQCLRRPCQRRRIWCGLSWPLLSLPNSLPKRWSTQPCSKMCSGITLPLLRRGREERSRCRRRRRRRAGKWRRKNRVPQQQQRGEGGAWCSAGPVAAAWKEPLACLLVSRRRLSWAICPSDDA